MTMIITDRPGGTHSLPTEWLGKRVVGWMFDEAGPAPWWVCALTRDGEWRYATHHPMGSEPDAEHKEYARKVCTHINRVANHGGAWLVAWIDNLRFYLLWKDSDGDIHIPIECDKGWEAIREWTVEDWAEQAEQAHALWTEFHADLGIKDSQKIKLAQGQRSRMTH